MIFRGFYLPLEGVLPLCVTVCFAVFLGDLFEGMLKPSHFKIPICFLSLICADFLLPKGSPEEGSERWTLSKEQFSAIHSPVFNTVPKTLPSPLMSPRTAHSCSVCAFRRQSLVYSLSWGYVSFMFEGVESYETQASVSLQRSKYGLRWPSRRRLLVRMGPPFFIWD